MYAAETRKEYCYGLGEFIVLDVVFRDLEPSFCQWSNWKGGRTFFPVVKSSDLFILPLPIYYRQFNIFNKQTWMISTQQSPRKSQ